MVLELFSDAVDFPFKGDRGVGLDLFDNLFSQRFNISGGSAAVVYQKVAMDVRYLSSAAA